MKDLFPGNAVRDEFQRWLDVGHGPFTVCQGGKDLVTFSCLEKTPSVNYLYRISSTQDTGVSWESSLLFCGIYDTEHRALYLAKDSLDIFTSGKFPLVSEVGPSMAETISGRINRRVEDTVANDRNNLPVGEVTDWRAKQDIQYYQERGAREEAIERFFSGKMPDGVFRSGYTMDTLQETAFLAWRQDPDGFIQTEAEMHIKTNQEKFLLQFLKNDALMEEYQVLAQDTVSAIHRMKGITDALKGCGAKAVTVTVEKDGEELTFKTGTSYLYGYRSSYSTSGMAAPDRREFERLFGRYAQYTAEEVTKITYGKKTVYEAPSSQEESMAESAGPVMGGGCKMVGEMQAPISRRDFQAWAGADYRLYENIRQTDGSVQGCTRHDLLPEVNALFVGSPENLHATMDLCGLYDKRLGEFRYITKELAAVVDGLSERELWDRSTQGPNLLQLVTSYAQNAAEHGYKTEPYAEVYDQQARTVRAGLNAMTAYAGVLASRGEEDAILELRDLAMYMREFWQDFLYAIYEKAGARMERQYSEKFDQAVTAARASGQPPAFNSEKARAILCGLSIHAEEELVGNENLYSVWRCSRLAKRIWDEYPSVKTAFCGNFVVDTREQYTDLGSTGSVSQPEQQAKEIEMGGI